MTTPTRRSANKTKAAALFAGTLVLLAARTASAQTPDCSTLTLPNPVYGDGGTAAQPYIGKLATILAGLATPITVLYRGSGGCAGIYGLVTPTVLTGTVTYWDAAGAAHTCNLPAVGGPTQQFGNQVNSHLLCPNAPATLPNTIGDVEGPVTAVNFVTGVTSTETSISSEAGYFIYGQGAAGGVTPWTTEAVLFKRNQNSAVGLYVGLAIGVQPNSQKGTLVATNMATLTGITGAADPKVALGYLSSDYADSNRSMIKTLAYQHKGQICGYLPDSSSTSFDKKNVRDGHYWLWGPQHFFGAIDATSKAFTDPNVAKLIGLVNGDVAPPAGVDITKVAIDTGNIPRCAFTAWRDGDLGELYSYAPPVSAGGPCACYFEKNVPGGSTTCKACTADADCSTVSANSKCRRNFCEAY